MVILLCEISFRVLEYWPLPCWEIVAIITSAFKTGEDLLFDYIMLLELQVHSWKFFNSLSAYIFQIVVILILDPLETNIIRVQ